MAPTYMYETLDSRNLLESAMMDCGCRSVAQFAERYGFHQGVLHAWRKGDFNKFSLITEQGRLAKPLRKLMEITGKLEWELFPDMDFPGTTVSKDDTGHRGWVDWTMGDEVQPEQRCVSKEIRTMLKNAIATLGEKERQVITLRCGLADGKERTLEEVGRVMNIRKERVRQLEAKGLRMLRHPSRMRMVRS